MVTPEQLQEQYATIERLYSEQQWDAVLEASAALQQQLAATPSHPLLARLDLVVGHTLIYGFADGAGAEARYRQVLNESEETVLREIAAQGLEHCQRLPRDAGEPQDGGPEVEEPQQAPDEAMAADPGAAVPASPISSAEDSSAANPSPLWAGAMPWEQALGEPTTELSPRDQPAAEQGPGAVAAMPWMVELGSVDPTTSQDLAGSAAFPAAPEAVAAAAEPVAPTDQREATDSLTAGDLTTGSLTPADRAVGAPEAGMPPGSEATSSRGGPIPAPMPELIPVTVQVLDEPEAPQAAAGRGRPGAKAEQPASAPEEPPPAEPSPEEMAALAPGLLEVMLR